MGRDAPDQAPVPTPGTVDGFDTSRGLEEGPDLEGAGREVAAIELDSIAAVLSYLVRGILPTNTTEARRLAHKAKAYIVVRDHLYKRSTSGILLKCIPHEQR
jgi:hypothetical protein